MHVRTRLEVLQSRALAFAVGGIAAVAHADINVGVTLSATGPAASLGIPEKNTFELLPTTIGGEKINWIVLDDGSDTTKAVHEHAGSCITENKVDVIVGSTITPNSLAMVDVVGGRRDADDLDGGVARASSIRPIRRRSWVFKTPQSDALMADAIAVSMKANGVKTMGYIGFADAYGDGWLAEIKRSAQTAGIKVVAEEKYNRNDPSVTGQVLKLVAANPGRDPDRRGGHARRDAAEGARRAQLQGQDLPDARRRESRLPARRRQGRQRHDPAVRPDAGLRAAARQQSDQEGRRGVHHASTSRSSARARRSAATPGTRTCCCAARSPRRSRRRKPGTKEFRAALRDALENGERRRRRTACS